MSPIDVIKSLIDPENLSLFNESKAINYLKELSNIAAESFIDPAHLINRTAQKPKSVVKNVLSEDTRILPFMPPLPSRHLYHITTNDEKVTLDGILDSYKVSSGSDMATLVAADLPISMGNIHDTRPITAIPCQPLVLAHTAEPVRKKFPVYPGTFNTRPMKRITEHRKIAAYPMLVSNFAPLMKPTDYFYDEPGVLESALIKQQTSILVERLNDRRMRWKECGFKTFNSPNNKTTKVTLWSDAFKNHVQTEFLYRIVNHANNESSNEDCSLKKYEPKSDKRKKHIPGEIEVQVESELNNGSVEALKRYIEEVSAQDSTKKTKSQPKALKYQERGQE